MGKDHGRQPSMVFINLMADSIIPCQSFGTAGSGGSDASITLDIDTSNPVSVGDIVGIGRPKRKDILTSDSYLGYYNTANGYFYPYDGSRSYIHCVKVTNETTLASSNVGNSKDYQYFIGKLDDTHFAILFNREILTYEITTKLTLVSTIENSNIRYNFVPLSPNFRGFVEFDGSTAYLYQYNTSYTAFTITRQSLGSIVTGGNFDSIYGKDYYDLNGNYGLIRERSANNRCYLVTHNGSFRPTAITKIEDPDTGVSDTYDNKFSNVIVYNGAIYQAYYTARNHSGPMHGLLHIRKSDVSSNYSTWSDIITLEAPGYYGTYSRNGWMHLCPVNENNFIVIHTGECGTNSTPYATDLLTWVNLPTERMLSINLNSMPDSGGLKEASGYMYSDSLSHNGIIHAPLSLLRLTAAKPPNCSFVIGAVDSVSSNTCTVKLF